RQCRLLSRPTPAPSGFLLQAGHAVPEPACFPESMLSIALHTLRLGQAWTHWTRSRLRAQSAVVCVAQCVSTRQLLPDSVLDAGSARPRGMAEAGQRLGKRRVLREACKTGAVV